MQNFSIPTALAAFLLASNAPLAHGSPQADLDVLAMTQGVISSTGDTIRGMSDLSVGLDDSWAVTALVDTPQGTPEFVILGEQAFGGTQGPTVLRRPATIAGTPQARLGRPSTYAQQLAYLASADTTPILSYESAWLEDQLLAEEGGPVGSSGRTWGKLTAVIQSPIGLFLRGGTSSGGVLFDHNAGTILLSVGDPVATMNGPITRIQRVDFSPSGTHWVARVIAGQDRAALIVDGALLMSGGAEVVESRAVGAGLGLPGNTWSSFGPMAVDNSGRVTFQATVGGASNGAPTIRGDRVIEPSVSTGPFRRFEGNVLGGLALFNTDASVFLEGMPIVNGGATLDVNGDGSPDAGYALGTNTIGETDWQPLGTATGCIGSVFIDVPGVTGDQQAIVRFQRSVQGLTACEGVPNSTGRPSTLTAFGRSGVQDGDLTLYCIDLPAGCMGYGLASRTFDFVLNPGGSDGNLCLGGSIGRLNGQMFTVPTSGRGTVTLDLAAFPQPTGTTPVTAGERWYFQIWHRDTCSTGATSNFSQSISVDFTQ